MADQSLKKDNPSFIKTRTDYFWIIDLFAYTLTGTCSSLAFHLSPKGILMVAMVCIVQGAVILFTSYYWNWPLYAKLKGMGLEDLVDFACSSDDTGFLKPDTHCFEYLLYNLNVRPEDVLYVGDSYVKDVAGAAGAGIDAVLVNVARSDLKDCTSRYPLAKAVFSDWKDFDCWLSARLEEN